MTDLEAFSALAALDLPPALKAWAAAQQASAQRAHWARHRPPDGHRTVGTNDRGHVVGADHPRARLSDADVDQILDLRAEGLSYRVIAAKFDDWPKVSKSMVEAICNGKRRAQTATGQKRMSTYEPLFSSADVDEFDYVST